MGQNGMITQCPSCATSFKVTQAQLSAADGAVRCGACLQIFQAADYICDSSETENDSDIIEEETTEEFQDESDLLSVEETASDTEDEAVDDAEDEIAAESSDEVENDAEEDDIEVEGGAEEVPADSDLDETIDGDELVTDSEDEKSIAPEGALEEIAEGASEEIAVSASEEIVVGASEEMADGALEEKAEGALEVTADGSSDKLSETESVEIVDNETTESESDEYIDGDSLQGKAGEIQLEDDLDLVGDYIPPVKSRSGLWILPIIGLLLLLSLQFAWFNKEILSQHPQLRSYYEYTCNVIACDLPHYSNSRLLSVSGLLIRTHPTTDRALKVDAILRNDGMFRQKFPRLQLRFTDINDQTIASRNFNPNEYLKGELTGLKFIPANTEVRLALEIVDPHAIGYSLMILPDQNRK